MVPEVHKLKIRPNYFRAVCDGRKSFEVRRDDRGFQTGDVLHLREYEISYTGNEEFVQVRYILTGGQLGIEPGYVVMSIELIGEGHPLEGFVLEHLQVDALAKGGGDE